MPEIPFEVLEMIFVLVTDPVVVEKLTRSSKYIRTSHITDQFILERLVSWLPAQYRTQLKFKIDPNVKAIHYLQLLVNTLCAFCECRETHALMNHRIRLCQNHIEIHSMQKMNMTNIIDFDKFLTRYEIKFNVPPVSDRSEVELSKNKMKSVRYSSVDIFGIAVDAVEKRKGSHSQKCRIESGIERIYESYCEAHAIQVKSGLLLKDGELVKEIGPRKRRELKFMAKFCERVESKLFWL